MPGSAVKKIWYRLASWGCRLFLILAFRFGVYGRHNVPDSGGVILASNHQSYLDPVFCAVALRRQCNYLARETLFINPVFRLLIKSLNAVPVRRGQADLRAMKQIINLLRQDKMVCLYPEGTRSSNGTVRHVKPGFGLLSRRSGATVVPTVIEGAYDVWPRHQKFFSGGKPVSVCYGEPIRPEQIVQMSEQQLADELTRRLRKIQNELRRRQAKQPFDYENYG